jgi:hypothetical protein
LPPASGNRYGYGIEAWGNQGNYNNNWLGIASNYPAAAAITWGWDGAAPSAGLYSVSNNTVCNGASWGGYQYSVKEVSQSITPTVQTGNNFTPNACTAVTSVAPTISPASGTFTTSQTVTFTVQLWPSTVGQYRHLVHHRRIDTGTGIAWDVHRERGNYRGVDYHDGEGDRHVGRPKPTWKLCEWDGIHPKRSGLGDLHVGNAADAE